jgi:hypothetical protein
MIMMMMMTKIREHIKSQTQVSPDDFVVQKNIMDFFLTSVKILYKILLVLQNQELQKFS